MNEYFRDDDNVFGDEDNAGIPVKKYICIGTELIIRPV